MKRCPKHPDIIITTWEATCECWVDEVKTLCGEPLVPLSKEERREIQIQELKDQLDKTTLPDWAVDGIRQFAWDVGHAYGQVEVDGYIQEWVHVFEELMKKAEKS